MLGACLHDDTTVNVKAGLQRVWICDLLSYHVEYLMEHTGQIELLRSQESLALLRLAPAAGPLAELGLCQAAAKKPSGGVAKRVLRGREVLLS